jgi:hypothetical protein
LRVLLFIVDILAVVEVIVLIKASHTLLVDTVIVDADIVQKLPVEQFIVLTNAVEMLVVETLMVGLEIRVITKLDILALEMLAVEMLAVTDVFKVEKNPVDTLHVLKFAFVELILEQFRILICPVVSTLRFTRLIFDAFILLKLPVLPLMVEILQLIAVIPDTAFKLITSTICGPPNTLSLGAPVPSLVKKLKSTLASVDKSFPIKST